jgi:hypothetical protein
MHALMQPACQAPPAVRNGISPMRDQTTVHVPKVASAMRTN